VVIVLMELLAIYDICEGSADEVADCVGRVDIRIDWLVTNACCGAFLVYMKKKSSKKKEKEDKQNDWRSHAAK
jgi:hypothetical protein